MTHYLPIGHTIQDHDHSGEYTIKSVLGRGASTVVYLTDYSDRSGCVSERILKEYYPVALDIARGNQCELMCSSDSAEKFSEGLARYKSGGRLQNELRTKACLKNETPPLQRIFSANNTCYLDVVPFEGRTFDKFDSFTLLERLKICLSVAKLINQYHKEGYLYLDLKPENIFVLTNSSGEVVTDMVVLIDFDSVTAKKDVAFGKSLSFTKSWAAPEQINPHAFRKISEATDIYALGELVFWSVFNRHSTEEEHRGFSEYPFDDATRHTIQQKLSTLFRKTLRSSPRNRFSSMLPVVELLENIATELAKREYIIACDIVPKGFFLGRDYELKALAQAIKTEKTVFVTGLAGIGKSELVKQFVQCNRQQYDNILHWIYDGSLISMLCDETSVSISSFLRYPEEDEEQYATRKLIQLSSLLTPSSLIIIDNVDTLVSEFDSPAVWAQILALPGKIIVASRCYEKEFKCVDVNELSDIALLRQLFLKYCPSASENDSQLHSIDRIISIAGKHTYEIELLAVYTEEKMQLPEDTLFEMEQEGFSSLTGTSLSVQKDGHYSGASFMEHLKKLLSMSKLSDEQKSLLIKLSFMPATGIDLKDFKEFYGFNDVHDLRWLIKHSFVSDAGGSSHTLTVHPTVVDVVVNAEKANDTVWEHFYRDALTAMRRGYDDPSVNQSYYEAICKYLNSSQFVDSLSSQNKDKLCETTENLRKYFASQYAKSDVSSAVFGKLCQSIAEKTIFFKLQHDLAAQYTTQYVEWFSKFGHYTKLLVIIQYALQLYLKKSHSIYCPDREYAYAVYADLSVLLGVDYSSTIELCKEHLDLARKAKDWHMAGYWCTNLAKLYFLITDLSSIKYQVLNAYYSMRKLWQKKPQHDQFTNSFTPNTTKINIRSAELNESMFEFYPPSDPFVIKWNLQMAIRDREKALDGESIASASSSNSVMIAIDRARISILELDFNTAIQFLSVALEPYCNGQYHYSVATKQAAELLGDVYTTISDYKSAISWYHTALQIADSVGENDPYVIKIKLGRAINLSGSDKAKQHNYAIWEEIKEITSDNLQRYIADASYNVGDYHCSVGEIDESERFIRNALAIYESCTHHRLHNNIGRARCYERLARIHLIRKDSVTAKELAQKATTLLEELLGSNHPEVKDFKAFLSAL